MNIASYVVAVIAWVYGYRFRAANANPQVNHVMRGRITVMNGSNVLQRIERQAAEHIRGGVTLPVRRLGVGVLMGDHRKTAGQAPKGETRRR